MTLSRFQFLRFLTIYLLIFLVQNINAQNETKKGNWIGLCLSSVPHYVLTSTFKGEIDKQIGKSASWLTLSASFADREDDAFWSFNFDNMITHGVSLAYRYYIFSRDEPKWLYVQSGFVYNNTQVFYSDERWETYNYNGLEAVRLEPQQGMDRIHQYGADMKVGTLLKIGSFVFFDFYGGFGVRRAEVEGVVLNSVNYGQGLLGPGYVGLLPVLGVRVGVNL